MDSLTVAIAVGLVISLLFTEIFGLSTGGMIVPGYVALHLDRPVSVLVTLLTAVCTFAVVKALSQIAIVYGRRRIVMMILVGFLFGTLLRALPAIGSHLGWASATDSAWAGCFCVVGYIVPGLIALWMDRQGSIETVAPLLTSAVVVRLVLMVIGIEVVS